MYKTGVIGDRESVLCYMSIGFTVAEAETPEETSSALHRLVNDEHAVIFITEAAASMIPDEIERYRSKPIPAVILIPGKNGGSGIGMAQIKSSVERAVGADILK